MSDAMFPIMFGGYRPADSFRDLRSDAQPFAVVGLPWAMIEPHEGQAQRNHSQTLKGLAGRGGLSACEALAILEDRSWRKMQPNVANGLLAARIIEYVALSEAQSTGEKK